MLGDLIGGSLPWIMAAIGGLWAVFSNKQKNNEKSRRKSAQRTAIAEQARAEVAEETTKEIMKSENISREKIEEARKVAETKRGRFTGQPFS